MGRGRLRSVIVAALTLALVAGQVPGTVATSVSLPALPDLGGTVGTVVGGLAGTAKDGLATLRTQLAPIARAIDCTGVTWTDIALTITPNAKPRLHDTLYLEYRVTNLSQCVDAANVTLGAQLPNASDRVDATGDGTDVICTMPFGSAGSCNLSFGTIARGTSKQETFLIRPRIATTISWSGSSDTDTSQCEGLTCFTANDSASGSGRTDPEVDTTLDPGDGTCGRVLFPASDDCTLREAINAANAMAGPDSIFFNISGTLPFTINVASSSLPAITDTATVDATSQKGFAGAPIVALDGTDAGTLSIGLWARADAVVIKGFAIGRFGQGIVIEGSNGHVAGNYLGTDVSGTAERGNRRGIVVASGSGNVIGGASASERNVISANTPLVGVELGSAGNVVRGNYIGLDRTGAARLGNATVGVLLSAANTIGGTGPGEGNVISGNGNAGVSVSAAGSGSVIQGNYIGTDATGTVPLGSVSGVGAGIQLLAAATVGGTSAEARNVISGNLRGIYLRLDATGGSTIQGNFIGTNAAASASLGNTLSGIEIDGVPNNTIGGSVAGAGNVIGGNQDQGIYIHGAGATGNVIRGNFIGTADAVGTVTLANSPNGIYLGVGGNTVADNTIRYNVSAGISNAADGNAFSGNVVSGNLNVGFSLSGSGNTFTNNIVDANRNSGIFAGFPGATTSQNSFDGNVVRNNGSAGIELRGPAVFPTEITERNRIHAGSITNNAGKGILLGQGANDGITPPTVTAVSANRTRLVVSGTALPGALVQIYADAADEGSDFLGEVTADVETGAWTKSTWGEVDLVALNARLRASTAVIRATQTDDLDNTSEFSGTAAVGNILSGVARCGVEGPALANATVDLLQGDTVLATTTSDAGGAYVFVGVGPGTFSIRFTYLVEEFERMCTVPATLDANGDTTFGTPEPCDTSNTWLTARTLTANNTAQTGVICDGGRLWYKIVLPTGSDVVPPLSRIVARLTGVDGGRLPGDFTLMLVKDPRLALQPVTGAKDAHTQFAGDTFGGDTFGGDTFGGDTFGGDTFGGDTFGGDTFGGDTFGGDTFGGDTFGGDTFGGDTFGGDTFGGDTFGGDTFGGDTFGGDTFGGDTFGGDTFGGNPTLRGGDPQAYAAAIARSVVRVAAHRGTSPEGLWQNTWANSITWYLRVSSYRGAQGAFHLSGQVFSGLCDGVTTAPVASSRTVPPPASGTPPTNRYETLILRNSALEGAGADPAVNGAQLGTLAAHGTVKGYVVDFAGDSGLTGAYAQYQSKPFCPFAANLIADGIRGYIGAFKHAHPELRWVLIAATDEGVPVYRIPDYSTLAPQSMLVVPLRPQTVEGELRLNFYGTDDAYGDFHPIAAPDHPIFLPELGVGRISEPKYIPTLVPSYLTANGLLTPQTGGVFGYNFWSDAANSIKDQLAATGRTLPGGAIANLRVNQFATSHPPIQAGQGLPTDSDAWNAQDLLDGVAADTDVFVLMAHGLRAAAIAPANYSPTLKPQELIQVGNTTPAIRRMKLLITGACNFALGLPAAQGITNATPDPETAEIPQALGWTAVAWDSYAYGDDERMAYSEELADMLVRELRYDTGPIYLGDALVRAKRAWAAPQTDLKGIPEKSLMAMGIVGFPMLRVDLGTVGRLERPTGLADFTSAALQPVAAGTPGSNATLNLRTTDITVDFDAEAHRLTRRNVLLQNLDGSGTTQASYYVVTTPQNATGFAQVTPLQPISPRWSVPLHPSDLPADSATFARGSVLLSASCQDEPAAGDPARFVPLVSVPAYQLAPPRGAYLTDRFAPNDWWQMSYVDSGREYLLIRPAQFRSAISPTTGAPESFGTERTFRNVTFRAYYSSLLTEHAGPAASPQEMQAILAGPPEILRHSATPDGNTIAFEVFVSGLPNLGIQSVLVNWWSAAPGAPCAIDYVPLVQDSTNGQRWTGTLTLPAGTSPDQIRYLLQAVNGAGRVRVADNFGLGFPAETPPTLEKPLADTALAFVAPTPTAAVSGRTITVAATLTRTDTQHGVAGKRLLFRLSGVNGYRAFAYTEINGRAQTELKVEALPGSLVAHVEFEGDDDLAGGSAASSGIAVRKETTTLAPTSLQPTAQQQGGVVQVSARLRDGLGRQLREQGVLFLVTAPACTPYAVGGAGCAVLRAEATETDFRGDAKAAIAFGLPLGSYRVHALFAAIVEIVPGTTLDLQNARYEPARADLGVVTVTDQKIAFTSGRTGNGDIYAMNVDGSGVVRLTDSAAVDADPDWSPDRSKIAFSSSRTGNGDVYVMNADGTGVTRLTTSSGIDTLGSWSPDGTKLAFTSTRDGNAEIYVMNADGSGAVRLTNNPRIDADPYWSPDGTKIAFTSTRDGNAEVYVMNANGTGVTRLTNNSAVDTLGSWAPDGARIAFTSGRTGNGDIYVMNADGSGVMRLTTSAAIDGTPDWSPDGTRIVFASTRDGNSEIYVMNADGTGVTRLTMNSAIDTLPSW